LLESLGRGKSGFSGREQREREEEREKGRKDKAHRRRVREYGSEDDRYDCDEDEEKEEGSEQSASSVSSEVEESIQLELSFLLAVDGVGGGGAIWRGRARGWKHVETNEIRVGGHGPESLDGGGWKRRESEWV